MIGHGSADMSTSCEMIFGRSEEELVIPGYSTEIRPEMPTFVRLVRK
jgi:hypothetical protein